MIDKNFEIISPITQHTLTHKMYTRVWHSI